MRISKKHIFLAFFIICGYAIALNELNLRTILKNNPENNFSNNRSTVYNYTILSIDNEWYVNQIKNFLGGKGFTIDPKKEKYNVRRAPVYPLFYGIHYVILGEEKSFKFIRYSQVIIFAIAAIALFFAVFNFTDNRKIGIISASLFAFNPTLVSYLYYTITEGLSPALVGFLLYFLSLCYKYNRKQDWVLTGIFFAMVSLCRPAIFILGPSLLFAAILINRTFSRFMLHSLCFVAGAAVLFLPHMIRNYRVTNGDIILLERYYGDPMDYGLPNMELRKWLSCWTNPADFSSEDISNRMILSICCDSTSTKESVVKNEMDRLPQRAFLANQKPEIEKAYRSLYDFYQAKTLSYPQQYLSAKEKTSMSDLKALKKKFIAEEPLQYFLVTPAIVVKSVILQSNSASLAYLDKYQGNYLKIGVKLLLYLLNAYLFLALIGTAMFARKYKLIYGVAVLFVFLTFVYITLEIKYFEARYLIPLFPFLYVTGAIFIVEIIAKFRKRLHF